MQSLISPAIETIKKNPIETKKDMQQLVMQLVQPLNKYFTKNNTYLFLGQTAAHYTEQVAGLEAFSRPLWGLAPLMAGGGDAAIWHNYIEGIKNGSNPDKSSFWGFPTDFDQRTVETAAFGLTLALNGGELLRSFTEKEKANLQNWLLAVHDKKTPDNNWHLFKVMVNMGLAKAGLDYDQKINDKVFAEIEHYYIGDGWYSDGLTKQKDYYISFAIHYYSLIYATIMADEDPKRSKLLKERATIFAKDFIYWFSSDGSSIPFGRSMTYRFAQTSFWSALAFAGVEAVDWGVIKGIVLRHLRWWMKRPIFTQDGVLTIGYGYPNLIMTESYNAPGSPYWSFKAFLVLSLDDNHPFWQAKEAPLPALSEKRLLKHAQMLMTRDQSNEHVVALTAGQYAGFAPAHTQEKYAKFAYSNQFGFSIARDVTKLEHGAFDSMLALSEKGDAHWRPRQECDKVHIDETNVYSRWRPWENVVIQTWLIPLGLWHIRVHQIQTERAIDTAEGGFAIPMANQYTMKNEYEQPFVQSGGCSSGIIDLLNTRELQVIETDPNTNMIFPEPGKLPTLLTTLEIGDHWLASAVLAHKNASLFREYWGKPPKLTVKKDGFQVNYQGNDFMVKK